LLQLAVPAAGLIGGVTRDELAKIAADTILGAL